MHLNMKTTYIVGFFVVALLLIGVGACEDPANNGTGGMEVPQDSIPIITYAGVTPVNFPNLNLPNFNFPEDSNTIIRWINNNNMAAQYTHVWGLWKGLTQESGQVEGGQALRVFETWQTPQMMINAMLGKPADRNSRHLLRRPKQLTHFANLPDSVISGVRESVAYSPPAADYAIDNKLLLATSIYQRALNNNPVSFPSDAITIKPIFMLLPKGDGDRQSVEVWHGPRDTFAGYAINEWNTYVYVDITNSSPGGANGYGTLTNGTSTAPTAGDTYNLNEFIHYTLTQADAAYYNAAYPSSDPAQPGDHVILMGMHVSTKEIFRWTWQTFWWTPDPIQPPAPSSAEIAQAQSTVNLTGAPAHYAASVAYYMVNPKEGYYDAEQKGEPEYAYNPYLEAPFKPTQLMSSGDLSQVETPDGVTVPTNIGMRTNCMSCHGMASIDASLFKVGMNPMVNNNTPYVGDMYYGLNASIFQDQFLNDFAWSISREMDTTGLAVYFANSK